MLPRIPARSILMHQLCNCDSAMRDFHLMNVIAGQASFRLQARQRRPFTPHTGVVFPPIVRNGTAGATTVATYPLHCPSLTVTSGIFSLGAALLDTVNGIVTGSGAGSLTF